MTLVTPILTKINTFDPALDKNVSFTYTGGQISKKRLLITNTDTLEIVYDDTQIGMNLYYSIPSNTLSTGQYLAQLQVFDFNHNTSELSEAVLFYCLSTPVLEFKGVSKIVNKANITVDVAYSQSQGDLLLEFGFSLYDKDKVLLTKSETMYDDLSSYTFYGLMDQQTYYIRCLGITSKGMHADTGYVEINVSYITQPNNMLFKLTNNKTDGYISVDCNIIDIGYEVGGKKDYIISDGEVLLQNGTTVTYNSGFALHDEFSIFVKARRLPLNKPFLVLGSGNGDITLSIVLVGDDYYCLLSAASAVGYYYRYALLPKAQVIDSQDNIITDENGNALIEVSMDYEDNYISVFELKRKNNLYSLKSYYEDNGIIIINETK